jgi:hypothetical protein
MYVETRILVIDGAFIKRRSPKDLSYALQKRRAIGMLPSTAAARMTRPAEAKHR